MMLREILEAMKGLKIYNLRTNDFIDWEKNVPQDKQVRAEDLLTRIQYKYGKGSLGLSTKVHKNPWVLFSTEIAMRSRFNHPADYLVFGSEKEANSYKSEQSQERQGTLKAMTVKDYLNGGKIEKV